MNQNQSDLIRKVLKTHGIDPQPRVSLQKCLGCAWIGWHHDEHLAEIIDLALMSSRWLATPEQLDALNAGDEIAGALIKCVGIANPESGRYDMGEVWEKNSDGTWCILSAPDSRASWEDRGVPSNELVLPALLLWEPNDTKGTNP